MPDLERLKRSIAGIAARPRAVSFDEIERVVRQLEALGWSAKWRRGNETWIFYVAGEKFTVCDHNRGSAHLKPVYVKNFLKAMINLGLYED
jgi:hypothetical protein